ncbi:Coenzyme A biosynthesis bifunctional protein CoaBC, partial [Haemophilus influenzae]
AKILI